MEPASLGAQMSEMKERFVCALVGAYAEATAYKEKDSSLFPLLSTSEDLAKRHQDLLEERLVSFERFCGELLGKPKENPRHYSYSSITPIVAHVIPAVLLFVRKPDELSRFIRRLYRDKTEASHDFALLYGTVLVGILEGKSPEVAVDFACRYQLGGGVFTELQAPRDWILKTLKSGFCVRNTDGSGYSGALVGAHIENFVLPLLPLGWRRMEKLALRLYEASQHVVVGKYT